MLKKIPLNCRNSLTLPHNCTRHNKTRDLFLSTLETFYVEPKYLYHAINSIKVNKICIPQLTGNACLYQNVSEKNCRAILELNL